VRVDTTWPAAWCCRQCCYWPRLRSNSSRARWS
jgi:hypothetical protein